MYKIKSGNEFGVTGPESVALDNQLTQQRGGAAAQRFAERATQGVVPLLECALDYASRGWPVFPLAPRTKVPLKGSHGFKDATTDEELVRHWWGITPDANIALLCGVAFDGIDIDGLAGERSLAEIFEHYGTPAGPQVASGRSDGGRHLLVLPTGAKSVGGLLDHVDLKARSGYLVAPPSIHPTGRRYSWLVRPDAPIPPAEEWLRDLLARRQKPAPLRPGRAGLAISTYEATIQEFNARHGVCEVLHRDWGISQAVPGTTIRCPGHTDHSPSLSIAGDDARVWCKTGTCVLSGPNEQGHDAFSLAVVAQQRATT